MTPYPKIHLHNPKPLLPNMKLGTPPHSLPLSSYALVREEEKAAERQMRALQLKIAALSGIDVDKLTHSQVTCEG
jgi:hypothetical protein